jgi:hypothetical protein
MRNRSILRDDLHKEFDELLENIHPDEEIIVKIQKIIRQKVKENEDNKDIFISASEKELKTIETKIEKYTERI